MMLQRFLSTVRRGQNGFSLIEMIVVIGIVSLLAAVIVPNIGKFIGAGDQGAKDSEAHTVQNALHAMMSEQVLGTLAASTTATSYWGDKPEGVGTVPLYYLDKYLREDSTVYYYCYDQQGIITRQDEAAAQC